MIIRKRKIENTGVVYLTRKRILVTRNSTYKIARFRCTADSIRTDFEIETTGPEYPYRLSSQFFSIIPTTTSLDPTGINAGPGFQIGGQDSRHINISYDISKTNKKLVNLTGQCSHAANLYYEYSFDIASRLPLEKIKEIFDDPGKKPR